MLEVENLHTYHGGIRALAGASLKVAKGQVLAIIGANGAGKSTLLGTIAGLYKPKQGKVRLDGRDITGLDPHRVVGAGMCLVPERRQVFADLTVVENLTLGAYQRYRRDRARLNDDFEWVYGIFPVLKERSRQLAGTLSGGEQQMLSIGRALMASPKLLMLDEPSLGLAPLLVKAIFETIQTINEQGVTVLLVEQNARAALRLADYGYVLETGTIALEGPASELLQSPRVRQAYLGERV